MKQVTTVIIGAGQTGLAMSRSLSARSIAHVVLERGAIGHSWRTERWDSLRMLTPNWANGLPGAPYAGPEPDGFMTAATFARQLESYAQGISAPVQRNTKVESVTHDGDGFTVNTDAGVFRCSTVVVATGAASRPHVPQIAEQLPRDILQVTPDRYKRASDLPPGGVLVAGASASGVQIARELRLAGHAVTLAVGGHVRLPRQYRGCDIEHWLHVTGVLDQQTAEIDQIDRARRIPSPQLMGGVASVDLNALQALGVSVVGRLSAIRDGKALFSGGLAHLATSADLKMHRLFDLVDAWISEQGDGMAVPPADRPQSTLLPTTPCLSMPLDNGAIRSVVWATGFRPDFSFLDLPVFDRRGQLRHDGGVCTVPGLYVLGLPLLRRRRSHQISGAGPDAEELATHLADYLRFRAVA